MAKRKTKPEEPAEEHALAAEKIAESAAHMAVSDTIPADSARISVTGEKQPKRYERKNTMKAINFILALISLIAVSGLGYFVYNMNDKLSHLSSERSSSNLAGDLAKIQNADDRTNEAIRTLQQNVARISIDSSQNTRAIDDMKNRINQLIDLVK